MGALFFMTIVFLAAYLGDVLCTPALGAENQMKILTLEEALQIALEKNKDIQKAREYRNTVRAVY